MKKTLLSLAFAVLCSLSGFAQATAYEVDEIAQCSYEVFDLTVQTPLTLGNQPAPQFTVTYFTTEADAANNSAPIAVPSSYIITGLQQTIWIRVENITDGSFDLTSFLITMQLNIGVPEFEDVITCGSYALPYIQWPALYYTEPNMGGQQIPNGTVITSNQTIYIHAVSGVCNAESSFTVTITGDGPALMPPNPIVACDENGDGFEVFDLQTLIDAISEIEGIESVTVHETQDDAEFGVNAIVNPYSYLSPAMPQIVTVYIRAVAAGGCVTVLALQLIVIDCTPSGNSFSGHVSYDTNGNGCDYDDPGAAGVWVYYTHDNNIYYAYTDSNGYYEFTNVPDGISYATVESIPGFNVAPQSMTISFPDGTDPVDNDFCITAATPVQDVLVYMYPVGFAVPGFDAHYVVYIQNVGTTTLSGTITIQYDASNLAFIPTPGITQSGNTLTINYSNLSGFQSQYFTFSGTLAQPPALSIGDVITFTAVVNPLTGDANPTDNTYVLDHQIMNSYDPNDITCKQGDFITETQADDYLMYTVRFQNTGTFQATNVRIEGTLDNNLDWSTFEPIAASHNFYTLRTDSDIKFMFDGINLPDSTSNEAASHGYVIYKIKPKATVQVGDTMSAQAGIYFDFNTSVITNTATTTVATMVNETYSKDLFAVYPNPASGSVNIKLQDATMANVTVTDVLGKTVITTQINNGEQSLDISALNIGVYFITIQSGSAQSTQKLLVK